MDPNNPRWQTAKIRRARSATFWKILVAATSSAALSAVIVASCLDGATARRDRDDEPAVVHTTSGDMPTDSTPVARVQQRIAAPAATVVVQPYVVETPPYETQTPPVADGQTPPVQAAPALAAPTVAAQPTLVTTDPNYTAAATRTSEDAQVMADDAPPPPAPAELRDANGNVIDPDDHGVNPNAPALSAGAGQFKTDAPPWAASTFTSDPNAGAGRFTTDAPPWSASAFTSDPNAGAGPFTTEWNIPAYGAVWR